MKWPRFFIGLTLLAWIGLLTGLVNARQPDTQQAPPKSPPAQQAPAQAPPAGLPPGYAGTASCIQCHDEAAKSFDRSRHGQAKDPRSPAGKLGCESCHGPGQAHNDDEAKGKIKIIQEAEAGRD